jgi:hypothetical protein
MSWTANGRTFVSLGITGAQIARSCWAEHSCELTVDGRNADWALLFATGESVEIKYGSTTRFVGEVQGPARRARGDAEGHIYRLINAWLVLAETVYEQLWTLTNGGSTANKARCIVGLKSDGTIGTLADAINDVLTFAGVAAGSITLAQTEEPWEVRNKTCAEVLRDIQRLAPRSVSWWTYPGGTPTFNVSTEPSSVSVAMTARMNVDLRPNTMQSVRGVRLQYEIVRTTDDIPQTDVVVDSAGATTGRRVLMQTIPWRGSSANFLRQTVKVRTIPLVPVGTNAQKKTTRQFWADRCPILRNAAPVAGDADLTPEINFLPFNPVPAGGADNRFGCQPRDTVGVGPVDGSGNYYFAVQLAHKDGGADATQWELTNPDDSGSAHIVLDTTLPRLLIEGTVTPWMLDAGKHAQRWTMHAYVTWLGQGAPGFTGKMVQISFTATDCINKEYTKLRDYAAGDPVPTGLAAQLYAALGATYHEGTVALTEDECANEVREGNALTITGGASEWGTMNALVQSVAEDILSGTTTLTVGVGTHLGTEDMLDLLRRERKRKEADTMAGLSNAASRGDGKV